MPSPEEWAEDITQNVFLCLSEHLVQDSLSRHQNIEGWLFLTLRNQIGTYWKTKCNYEISVSDIDRHRARSAYVISDGLTFPDGLSREERDLLIQCDVMEMPYCDVAATLGITEAACRKRLHRAEKHFRELTEK